MKAYLMFTGTGPIVVLTSLASVEDEVFVGKLRAKGVEKFIAHEMPLDEVKAKYGHHFETVVHDLHETDDLRVLDINGHRVFQLFSLRVLGKPLVHEPEGMKTKVYLD